MLLRDAVGSSGNSTAPCESTRGCHIGKPSPATASLTVELAPSATTARAWASSRKKRISSGLSAGLSGAATNLALVSARNTTRNSRLLCQSPIAYDHQRKGRDYRRRRRAGIREQLCEARSYCHAAISAAGKASVARTTSIRSASIKAANFEALSKLLRSSKDR